MDRLAEAPLTASPIFNPLTQPIETRRMLVKRFPYSIIFVEYQEDLWVIALCSQSAAARLLARTADTIAASNKRNKGPFMPVRRTQPCWQIS